MDFHGKVKTNHFKPKDLEAVVNLANRFNLRHDGDASGITLYAGDCCPDDGGEELDWEADLLPLVDGVLTVTEVGSEGFRYLHGYAVAYKEGHKPVVFDLSEVEKCFAD